MTPNWSTASQAPDDRSHPYRSNAITTFTAGPASATQSLARVIRHAFESSHSAYRKQCDIASLDAVVPSSQGVRTRRRWVSRRTAKNSHL